MARNTLARRRHFGASAQFLRDPDEGGGGGNEGGGAGNNGGSGSESGSGAGSGGDGGGEPDRGYPPNTPLVEMTVEQREAYHKHHSRQWQQRAEARSDYDEQKRLADLYRQQQQANETPGEQQLREAEERGKAAATAAKDEEQVQNLLRVALGGRGKEGDDLEELVAAANPKAFITDGKVDAAKVTAYASKIAAPAGAENGGQQRQQQRHGAGGHRQTGGGKPDVADVRGSMERALGRRPKANTGA